MHANSHTDGYLQKKVILTYQIVDNYTKVYYLHTKAPRKPKMEKDLSWLPVNMHVYCPATYVDVHIDCAGNYCVSAYWGLWPWSSVAYKLFAFHAGALGSFPDGDNAEPQIAEQTINKGCTDMCIKSARGASKWTFMNHKSSCQDDWFTAQSYTPMVANGKLASSQSSLKLIHV